MDWVIYEGRRRPLAPFPVFMRRFAAHVVVAVLLIAGSLGLGMVGYHHYEHLAWLDAFLNAAMLLGGMGPVESPSSHGGKVFAGLYALYAGLVFLVAVSLMLAPVFHRMLHRFHLEADEGDSGGGAAGKRKV
jgi:hypothetical protein